jgi:site-specific DNA-cytosine methylase
MSAPRSRRNRCRYLQALNTVGEPEWVAMEEAPDVLPLWKQYAAVLRRWGFSVWTGTLNAADYGVPQTRRRANLLASRVRTTQPPAPTHAQVGEPDSLFGPVASVMARMPADAVRRETFAEASRFRGEFYK